MQDAWWYGLEDWGDEGGLTEQMPFKLRWWEIGNRTCEKCEGKDTGGFEGEKKKLVGLEQTDRQCAG